MRVGGGLKTPKMGSHYMWTAPKEEINPVMAAAVQFLLCLLSLTASNISCVALVSFFLTTLPAKRNLLTFFDIVLVVALTCVVDIGVRKT